MFESNQLLLGEGVVAGASMAHGEWPPIHLSPVISLVGSSLCLVP